MEEPLRYMFISRGTPTYENVYRPQKVDSVERKSITARLLSGKFYVKICYILYRHIYIYSTISRGTPDDVLCNPRVPGNPGWETLSDVRWKIFRDIFPENFPFLKIIT
jgi:hypothetical protein